MTRAVAVAPAPAKHLMQLLAVMLFLVLPLTMVSHPVLGPVFGLDAAHAANQGTLNTYANQQRTAAGVKPLKVNARMTAVAQNAAARYANAGKVNKGENLSGSITTGWTGVGQVPHKYSPTTDPAVVYQRALAEPGKAATMNDGSWTDIGAGFATVGNATYVVVIYAKYPDAPKPVADPVPAPAPAPKVEAPKVVAPAPAPAPVVEAPKAQEPAPAPKVKPAPKPEPAPVPTQEAKPVPTKKPEPTKAPSPSPKATPTPTPEPSPEPTPSPEPDDERWRTLLGMDDGDTDLQRARDHSLASSLYLLFGGSGGLALYAGRKVVLLGK